MSKLISNIPANNKKIIELFNDLETKKLNPKPMFQRKLVWRKQHKFDFIETILSNFPFPEVYIAPGIIDPQKKTINEFVVDGQQRLTTIQNYINGFDVFGLDFIPIKKFEELSEDEKRDFLSYEVSVRYLKNANDKQIAEIFQRINRTEYALNKTERINAQWGDSEFICFGKQIIEESLDINEDLINYKIKKTHRTFYLSFFHNKNNIFTGNDINRMLSLQFILTLIATICEGKYFNRNIKVDEYIKKEFEEFKEASIIDNSLINVLKYINKLNLEKDSYWFNKANLFTLIVELYKYDLKSIDSATLKSELLKIEDANSTYLLSLKRKTTPKISVRFQKFIEASREGINGKVEREIRGKVINEIIKASFV